ncbi:MAG: hypothetical protein IJR07_02515 [Bacteroidaceae bacterium]|nr:hypothetical protein [Bacteroidaceae bacterium]
MDRQEEKKKLSRKGFLQLCGSVAAGAVIAGGTGSLLWKMFAKPDDVFYNTNAQNASKTNRSDFKSPYRKVSSFKTGDEIEAFEVMGDRIVVATPNNLNIYTAEGSLINNVAVGSDVRDIAVSQEEIYVLFPTRIEVYDADGSLLKDWDACSVDSDYCSLTVFGKHVFVTDAANKNICQYQTDGTLGRFINSPKGFVVPSYSFSITHIGETVYCSNPGRHSVESYSQDGEFLTSFGEAGLAAGRFSGCCNPVYVTASPTGEILTSEKGIPRISCYSPSGEFRSILLDEKTLGGGHDAYEMRILDNDKIVVAGKNSISTYQYDKQLAKASAQASSSSACALCGIDCPLRVGVTI